MACEDEEMEEDDPPLPSQPLQDEKKADIIEAPAILHPPSENITEPAKSPALKQTQTNREIIDESQLCRQDKTLIEGKCKTNMQPDLVSNLKVHKLESHSPSKHNCDIELSKPLSPKTADTKINHDKKMHNESSHAKMKESLVNPDLKENCDTEIPPPTNPLKEQNRTTTKKTLSPKQNQASDIDISKIMKKEVKIVIEPLKYPEIPSKNNQASKIDTKESSSSKKIDTLEKFILQSSSKRVKISKLKLVSRSTEQSSINIESLVSVPIVCKASTVEAPVAAHSSTSEVKIEIISLPAVRENCRTPKELIQFLKLLESETTVQTVIKVRENCID